MHAVYKIALLNVSQWDILKKHGFLRGDDIMSKERSKFSGSIGFVLAAAGSAVGLGNLWRFPYLAAKDGGGLFLVIYLILVVTFGFTLLMSEVGIGRKTKQSALTAYGTLSKGWGWIGIFATIVPFFILPYYAVIGGWVVKYFAVFVSNNGDAAADDAFFGGFITGNIEPIIFMLIFLGATIFVIYRGVNKGIEALSKVLMPVLLILIIGISIFALTVESEAGPEGRTGLDGFLVYVIPDVDGLTFKDLCYTIMDAMGQLFYSISVAMGIMVTYASYFRDKENLVKSVNRIEFFDTLVAFLAGVMIIPVVYVFMGKEGMSSAGPGLMFVAIPKVFAQMGTIGTIIGIVFFLAVIMAALTSCISIMEAVVAGLMDKFGWSRKKATIIEGIIALVLALIVCLGYNIFYFEYQLPNGATAQILDIFDYVTNNVLMPVVAIGTCLLIGWKVKPKTIIDEATKNGEHFSRRMLYIVMVKFITPIMLAFLLLSAFGII